MTAVDLDPNLHYLRAGYKQRVPAEYFVDIDDTHSAMGSYRKNDDVFYWMVLGSPETMPVIL